MNQVTVVIPAFNHSEFIGEAISSVLNSQQCKTEIIVVDDGSVDETAKIVSGFPSVKYFFQENHGAHSAINFGVSQASSNFISILNDDDMFSPTYLVSSLETLNTFDLDLVATIPQMLGSGSKLKAQIAHSEASLIAIEKFGLLPALFKVNWFVSTSGLVFKKKFFDATLGFRNYKLCHDLDFVLRGIMHHNLRMGLNTLGHWYYRSHGKNTSSSIDLESGHSEILEVLMGVLGVFLDSKVSNVPFERLVGHGISQPELANFIRHYRK